MKGKHSIFCLLSALAMLVACYSCASIGTPTGGPRDYTPPVCVRANPPQGSTGVKPSHITLDFDEFITLSDQTKKVSVSPAQRETPVIRSLGKRITIELRDTLLPNTTYTIDFADAIQDNNEENKLDGFTYAFSTGDSIDSLQVSGIVLGAADLEPMQHVTVGIHSNLSDTAFSKLPFDRITRTNDKGQFTLHNLKPGRYHIFALNDVDGDNKMARTEDQAFSDEIIVPSSMRYTSSDTVFTFDHKVDTVVEGQHTMFLPNNILLNMYNEQYTPLYIKDTRRPDDKRLVIQFSGRTRLPQLTTLDPAATRADWFRLERNERNDSLIYWLADSALIKADTLRIAMRYQFTDSTGSIVLKTDTLKLAQRKTNAQLKEEAKQRKQQEKLEKRRQEQAGKAANGEADDSSKHDDEEDEEIEAPKLEIRVLNGNVIAPGDTLKLEFDAPVGSIKPGSLHLLTMLPDSTWQPVPDTIQLHQADTLNVRRYIMPAVLAPGSQYRLTVDSLGITSVYGVGNMPFSVELRAATPDEYAQLTVSVNAGDNAFMSLLSAAGAVEKTLPVRGGKVVFKNVKAGTHFLKLYIDRNGNGRWDPGDYSKHLQPEETFYYPSELKLRKNWDVAQAWDIYAAPVDKQKPEKILKNKPEKRKNDINDKRDEMLERRRSAEDDEEDEFNGQGTTIAPYSGDRYRDYQNSQSR